MISLSDIPKADENTLCVLGNGFDLMHGVQSSYYDFSKTIGKKSYLRFCLENYLMEDDLWADFENNLAKINIGYMCSSFLIDDRLDEMNAYDEDATIADFYVAAETAAEPIITIAEELPKRFSKWVNKLYIRTDDRPLRNILGAGLVLNFNYTEFVETLYGVDKSNVCYIHGCRRKIKGQPRDNLILGHMPGDSEPAYDFAAIIDNVDDANNVTWYIGCYGENDVQQAEKFINSFDISKEKVNIFRTNNVKVNIFDKSDKVYEKKLLQKNINCF